MKELKKWLYHKPGKTETCHSLRSYQCKSETLQDQGWNPDETPALIFSYEEHWQLNISQGSENCVVSLLINLLLTYLINFKLRELEVYLEPCHTSKMDRFAKIVNSYKPLTIFAKRSILDIWQGSEYIYENFNST